jgi:hypothetical protein
VVDTTRREEEELRQWFRRHGLEAPNPVGRLDRGRWGTQAPVAGPARDRFVAAAVAFFLVLGGGAVWLYGRHTGPKPLSGEGSRAPGPCGVVVKTAEQQYSPLANLPDGGEILYSSAGHPCYWEVTFTSTPPSALLSGLLLHGFHVSWTYGDPSPKRLTPILPMSPVAPGGNINPSASSAGPS